MIRLISLGRFDKTTRWLNSLKDGDIYSDLQNLAERGVSALSANTPKDTGQTAASWNYTIDRSKGGVTIAWTNSNNNRGAQIAILLQYGHGTGTGGYVAGRDYINPAVQPVMDQIAAEVWKKVTRG